MVSKANRSAESVAIEAELGGLCGDVVRGYRQPLQSAVTELAGSLASSPAPRPLQSSEWAHPHQAATDAEFQFPRPFARRASGGLASVLRLRRLQRPPKLLQYRRLRDQVLHADHQAQLYNYNFRPVSALLEAGRFEAVIRQMRQIMPFGLLTRRVHTLLSIAHNQLGQPKLANDEYFLGHMCKVWMELTGDGSEQRPFRVTSVADEYDWLELHGPAFASQALVRRGKRSFDVLTAADGTETWFEITRLLDAAN